MQQNHKVSEDSSNPYPAHRGT